MRKHLRIVEENKVSQGIRLANYFLDLIVLIVINLIISYTFTYLYEITLIEFFYFFNNGGLLWDILSGSLVSFTYYFLFENLSGGRTLGKIITNTKVISIDGTKPTTLQFFYRSLVREVPFDSLSFLGQNGWHDSWTDTRVVNIHKYESEINAKAEIESIGIKEIA